MRIKAEHVFIPDHTGLFPLSLEFCPPTKRKFDRDNALAAMKGALDGLAQALEIDDSQFEPILLRRGQPTPGGVVIVRIGEDL